MSSNFRLIYLVMFLLVACGGSKSDVNDPILSNSGNVNNTNNTSTTTTTNTNTSSTSATQSYTFNNDLVWSDEFDQASFSTDNWNIETVPPNNGSWWNGELQYYTDKEDLSLIHI